MSEIQLREAHSLMKQGKKSEAIRIVQNVIREDRSNINAWWLFSMLLEDEEKIVRALEKILALNPDHLGARRKLSEMRPAEYAHLAPKAKNTPNKVAASIENTEPKMKRGRASSTALVVAFIIGSSLLMFSLLMPNIATMIDNYNLEHVVGLSPEEVARTQLDAAFSGNFETMRLHTCDRLDRDWEYNMNDFQDEVKDMGLVFRDIDVDVSGFTYTLEDGPTLERYFTVSGPIVMRYHGQTASVNVEDLSYFNVYIVMVIEDNHWKVCSL